MDTTVYTPHGPVLLGDLKVGDSVIDPTTGGGQRVLGVFPQGRVDIYRVTFDDGSSLKVGGEHLWLFREANRCRPGGKKSLERQWAKKHLGGKVERSRWDRYRVGDTNELIAMHKEGRGIRMPLSEPVIFTRRRRGLTLDPYLLGLVLGDGCTTGATIRMTSADKETIDYLLNAGATDHKGEKSFGLPVSVRPFKMLRQFLVKNDLLGCHSWEKFIPESMLYAPLADRLALLQGLLDTDGTADERGRIYFISTSKRLAEGVQHLVRSLGGKARLRERQTHYTSHGEKKPGRPSYQIRVWHPRQTQLFRLTRKRERCKDGWNGGHELSREVVSIEYVGKEEAQCIKVSGPRGLYLADDFIVTHNSDLLLGKFWLQHASQHAARGVIFRRKAIRLEDMIRRSFEIYPQTGAKFVGGSASMWRWPNGATLAFRPLWDEKQSEDYKTYSYTYMAFEQVEEWPNARAIDRLRGALRSPEGWPVRMVLTGNPGGVGHQWVKLRYIDQAPGGYVEIRRDKKAMHGRMFIPALLEDNPLMTEKDPGYEQRLLSVGSDELVRGWRYGDWNIVAGGFFAGVFRPDIEKGLQILHPFKMPMTWQFIRSFDWGSAKPSSLGFYGVSDGTPVPMDSPYYAGKVFPPGSLVRFGEWYTVAKQSSGEFDANVGLRLSNNALGRGIAERSKGRRWAYSVADPSIFTEMGDPSIYDRMVEGSKEFYSEQPRSRTEDEVEFVRANHDRATGWQAMMDMIREAGKEYPENPGLWVVRDLCPHWMRTVPEIPRSEKNWDDVNTESEDHCFVGGTLVATPEGSRRIDSLQDGDLVGTFEGWEACQNPRRTRFTETVFVELSDGSRFQCTTDHEWLTESGWVRADQLDASCYVRLAAWLYSSSQRPSRSSPGIGSTSAGGTSARGPSKRAASSAVQCSPRLASTAPPPASARTPASPRGAERPVSTTSHALAPSADPSSRPTDTAAPRPALVRVVEVSAASIAEVWCLTVPRSGRFLLANGAIVHNCADETRYAILSADQSGQGVGSHQEVHV